jgi:hypothetical protein
MKKLLVALTFLLSMAATAQKPCEIDSDVKDSLGTYKALKQQMIFERSFAGNSNNIFFALSSNNGILGLEVQFLTRSSEFISANCFDADSKIYLQLNNGKIATLIYHSNDTCGTLVRDDKNGNNRIMSGTFLFTKENFADLRESPVTYMRVKFVGETIDYPFKTVFVSELDKTKYEPEKYFMDYLKCLEN